MSRHMILWDEGNSTDSVRVYTEDPSVLVTSDRADLQVLKEIPEASKPGVYVLMGDHKRYVGQASSSVWSRINSHDKNKDWWTRVLFFSRIDGHLDKSQLDYLEAKLIRQFTSVGFEMENKDAGNLSYIGPYQRGQAESLLSTVESILIKDVGLDIFKKRAQPKVTVAKIISSECAEINVVLDEKKIVKLRSENFGEIIEPSWRRIHAEYVKAIWATHKTTLVEKMSGPRLISLTSEIEPERLRLFLPIDDLYSLNCNYSRDDAENRLHRIAEIIGDSVIVAQNSI